MVYNPFELPNPSEVGLPILLGNANTELKCLVLGNLPLDTVVSQRQLHHGIMVEASGNTMADGMHSSVIGDIVEDMSEEVADVWRDEVTNERLFEKTPVGEVVTAMGGLLLRQSIDSRIPIRHFVGDRRRMPEGQSSQHTDAVEVRRVVLKSLITPQKGTWQRITKLETRFENDGVGLLAGQRHINTLVRVGLVEKQIERDSRNHRVGSYRINPDNGFHGHVKPAEMVRNYLEIVDRFVDGDAEVIEEGLDEMQKLARDPVYVPHLVKRSRASTRHTGKTYTQKPKQDE